MPEASAAVARQSAYRCPLRKHTLTQLSTGVLSVLRAKLLPQLCLNDLQSLTQTCQDFGRLVLAADSLVWTAAAANQSRPTACMSAANPYASAAQLAAQLAAVKAGQGHRGAVLSGAFMDALLTEPMLLHPAFAEVAHGDPRPSSFHVEALRRGVTRTRDEAFVKIYAFFPRDQGEVSPPEQCCAPDGEHYLAMRVPDGRPELCGSSKECRLHAYSAHCIGRARVHLKGAHPPDLSPR